VFGIPATLAAGASDALALLFVDNHFFFHTALAAEPETAFCTLLFNDLLLQSNTLKHDLQTVQYEVRVLTFYISPSFVS
jgi:hypothetical protein